MRDKPDFRREIDKLLKRHDKWPTVAKNQNELGFLNSLVSRTTVDDIVEEVLRYSESSKLISDLNEFDHGEDEDFVKKTITNYVFERPWVLEDDFISLLKMGNYSLGRQLRARRSIPCQKFSSAETLLDLSRQDFIIKSQNVDGSWTLEPKETGSAHSELPQVILDGLLGLAGFVPVPVSTWQTTSIWIHTWIAVHRDACLRDFRDNISLEKHSADGLITRVCFIQSTDPEVRPNLYHLLLRIMNAVRRLDTVLRSELVSSHSSKLYFLNAPRPHNAGASATSSIQAVTFAALDVATIRDFLNAVFDQESILYDLCSEYRRNVRSPTTKSTATTKTTATTETAANPPFISALSTLGQRLDALYPCLKAMDSIPHVFNTGQNDEFKYNSALHKILHRIALIVQSTALVIQVNIRDMVLPLEFSFLDGHIHGLVLEGASRNKAHAKIFATSQKLTCLGSMINKPVLVFSTQQPRDGGAVNLEATPAELLSVWGPGRIAYRSGREVDGKPALSMAYLEIGGGYLTPAQTDERDPHTSGSLWHWGREPPRIKDRNGDQIIHQAVDLATCITIGAGNAIEASTSSATVTLDPAPPSLSASTTVLSLSSRALPEPNQPAGAAQNPPPIRTGPSVVNESCIGAIAKYHDELRAMYEQKQYLGHVGTSADRYEITSLGGTVGFQYFAAAEASMEWSLRQGTTVKQYLCHPDKDLQSFDREMNTVCGLLVSICTAVMSRMRLRHVFVAFIDAERLNNKCPGTDILTRALTGAPGELLLSALRASGPEPLKNWIQSSFESEQEKEMARQGLKQLLDGYLRLLKHSGVCPNGIFKSLWLHPEHPTRVLNTAISNNPWLRILRDNDCAATFAVITRECWTLRNCPCSSSNCPQPPWNSQPEEFCQRPFVLSTRMVMIKDGKIDNKGVMQCDKCYTIVRRASMAPDSSRNVPEWLVLGRKEGLYVRVVKIARENDESVYYLEVPQRGPARNVIPWMRSRIHVQEYLEDYSEPGAKLCVIGQ